MFDDVPLSEVIRNKYRLEFDQLELLIEQGRHQTSTTIIPLDEKERLLGRQTEVLGLQREVLEDAKNQAPLSAATLAQLNQLYQQKLLVLVQDMTIGYQNYLKERVPDKEECAALLGNFQQALEHELKAYQTFQLTAESVQSITVQLKGLNDTLSAQLDQIEMFSLLRTEIVDLAEQRHEFLGDRQRQVAASQQTATNNPHVDFLIACSEGNVPEVQRLVQMQKKNEIAEFINRPGVDGRNGLHQACGGGHYEAADYLLKQKGINVLLVDAAGYNAFHYAALKNYPNTSTILQVLARNNPALINNLGPYARTALHTAALFGNLTAVKWLIKNKADINAVEKGTAQRTPLHNAAWKGHAEIAGYLLENGANPLALNVAGETPLFEALFYGQEAVARVFRDRHFWLTPLEQKQLQEHIKNRPVARHCLLKILQPEMELYNAANGLEATDALRSARSVMPAAAQLGASLSQVWRRAESAAVPPWQISNNNNDQSAAASTSSFSPPEKMESERFLSSG